MDGRAILEVVWGARWGGRARAEGEGGFNRIWRREWVVGGMCWTKGWFGRSFRNSGWVFRDEAQGFRQVEDQITSLRVVCTPIQIVRLLLNCFDLDYGACSIRYETNIQADHTPSRIANSDVTLTERENRLYGVSTTYPKVRSYTEKSREKNYDRKRRMCRAA